MGHIEGGCFVYCAVLCMEWCTLLLYSRLVFEGTKAVEENRQRAVSVLPDPVMMHMARRPAKQCVHCLLGGVLSPVS